ncbi:MAG: ArsR family transcriptional regulator [Methanomicrobiales archaeon]|nr:ArsR family transcriptional regulator [Methanomicrobiales archaeon]
MKSCLIFHSYSGITRGVAQKVKAACGSDLIEVIPRKRYSNLTAYTVGSLRAMRGESDLIDPETINVSSYDLIVIGTPVWAFRATPVINAAVAALKGFEGKKAVIFATCGGSPGETIPILKKALTGKGVTVIDAVVFTRKDLDAKTADLITAIKTALPT